MDLVEAYQQYVTIQPRLLGHLFASSLPTLPYPAYCAARAASLCTSASSSAS